MSNRGDQPAFPTLPQHYGYHPDAGGPGYPAAIGITIRELYIALIAAGLNANRDFTNTTASIIAQLAREQADVLLAEPKEDA